MRALLVLTLIAACGDDTYLIVTVNARDSVHGAAVLEITETNSGTMRIDTLQLDNHAFPVTFSISAPGRMGQLDLSIRAKDDMGQLVGLGSGSTLVESKDAAILLDPADFVVNTEVADDQFLTTDFETLGFQLSQTMDGNWTVAFRSKCTDTCNVFARRFDATGTAVRTAAASNENAFPITTTTTQSGAFPAIAGSMMSTISVWDFTDTVGGGTGVACRGLDAMGQLTPGQLSLATENADTVSVAPLSNGNFAVSWQVITPADQIHTIIVKPDCNTLSGTMNPSTISATVGASNGPHRAHAANNGANVVWAWITDDAVRVHSGSTGVPGAAADSVVITPPAGSVVEAVRVAPFGTGFALVARLSAMTNTQPGSILLSRATATGQLMAGAPILVTDKSGSDFSTGHHGFGVATRDDGALMVVWHQCDDGSSASCDGRLDVYGRVFRPSGAPVGDPFVIATATVSNQVNPSVVALPGGVAFAAAWNDASKTPPDDNGTAVRARVLYPPYNDAKSILGAECGAGLPACNMGLACAAASDVTSRCFTICTPSTCPGGGTCSPALDGITYACTF